ncbi:hypothetical protein K1719_005282 [Acacia pycnantha]|nr:hypothetical protein K1719_005282 [Acacia pycnantha]
MEMVLHSYSPVSEFVGIIQFLGGPGEASNAFFGEYRSGRVSWSKALTDDEILGFVGRTFINRFDWPRI